MHIIFSIYKKGCGWQKNTKILESSRSFYRDGTKKVFQVARKDDSYWLEDVGATRICVNDREVRNGESRCLCDGDRITVGKYTYLVSLAPDIPGYRLYEFLGRGGMGAVFKYLDIGKDHFVAVKCLMPKRFEDRDPVDRYMREVQALQSLRHKNIVGFHGIERAGDTLCIVMDFVNVHKPDWSLPQSVRPPVGRTVGLMCKVLEALEYAHALRIVHRDLKPANLLLVAASAGEPVKVSDFGLAWCRTEDKTMSGTLGGTPEFMALEQLRGLRHARFHADQYSAAATLYFLLTGRYTHNFPTAGAAGRIEDPWAECRRMVSETGPIPIQRRRPGIPLDLAEVIHKALAREPKDRYGDPEDEESPEKGVGDFRKALLRFTR